MKQALLNTEASGQRRLTKRGRRYAGDRLRLREPVTKLRSCPDLDAATRAAGVMTKIGNDAEEQDIGASVPGTYQKRCAYAPCGRLFTPIRRSRKYCPDRTCRQLDFEARKRAARQAS